MQLYAHICIPFKRKKKKTHEQFLISQDSQDIRISGFLRISNAPIKELWIDGLNFCLILRYSRFFFFYFFLFPYRINPISFSTTFFHSWTTTPIKRSFINSKNARKNENLVHTHNPIKFPLLADTFTHLHTRPQKERKKETEQSFHLSYPFSSFLLDNTPPSTSSLSSYGPT